MVYDHIEDSLESRCKFCNRIILFNGADFCSDEHEIYFNEENLGNE